MEPEVCFVRSFFLNDFDLKFAIEYLVFDIRIVALMASLEYVEPFEKQRYRKFLHQTFPWIGHVGITHSRNTPLISAAKHHGNCFIELGTTHVPWTNNSFLTMILLISRNEKRLMSKSRAFIYSLLKFAKTEL